MSEIKRILLVEDEELLRDIYLEVLVESGYEVETAKEGNEAEHKMREGGYDLVLLDLMLPNKDGVQVLKDLQQKPASKLNKSIVYMTNLAQDNILNDGAQYGVRGALTKSDLTPDQFLEKVKEYLG